MSQKVEEPIMITHSNRGPGDSLLQTIEPSSPLVDKIASHIISTIRFHEPKTDTPTTLIPEGTTLFSTLVDETPLGGSDTIYEEVPRYCIRDDCSKVRPQGYQQLKMLDDTEDYLDLGGDVVNTSSTTMVQSNFEDDAGKFTKTSTQHGDGGDKTPKVEIQSTHNENDVPAPMPALQSQAKKVPALPLEVKKADSTCHKHTSLVPVFCQ